MMLHHNVTPRDLDLLHLLTAKEGPTGNSLARNGVAPGMTVKASPNSSSSGANTTTTTSATPSHQKSVQTDRRPPVDPLMVAAAASAGPDVTRNHYLHEFFPHTLAYASCDDERMGVAALPRPQRKSQQAPRRIRLALEQAARLKEEEVLRQQKQTEAALASTVAASSSALAIDDEAHTATDEVSPLGAKSRRLSMSDPNTIKLLRHPPPPFHTQPAVDAVSASSRSPATTSAAASSSSSAAAIVDVVSTLPPLVVRCEVRTRIPTPHGHIFLHLYTNNHDSKEHLAFVADQAQMDALHPETDVGPPRLPFIRSNSLDTEWREGETEMERIVRGAYTGRLSATSINPSTPRPASPNSTFGEEGSPNPHSHHEIDPPLVRIHSECFTGETIGSQRCDCGEQLDEAFRLITLAQRGVIVYLRQEGRGIGLLEKMRAYNLQDLGHDTVAANLMLGHGADQRKYDIAGAILRDLTVPEVKLLTNNPDKIEQIEKEGIRVVERVAMVPRSWIPSNRLSRKKRAGAAARRPKIMSGSALLQLATETMFAHPATANASEDEGGPGSEGGYTYSDEDEGESEEEDDDDLSYHSSDDSDASHNLRRAGVGMIGASVTRSAELDKYLKTKIERMGHMLELPPTTTNASSTTSSRPESPAPGMVANAAHAHHQHNNRPQLHSRKSSARSRTTSHKLAHGEDHPLASSIVSETGTPEPCGSGCEECEEEPVLVERSELLS